MDATIVKVEDARGRWDIEICGEIFYLRFRHAWNLEDADKFFETYRDVIIQSKLRRFGVLVDLRKFIDPPADCIYLSGKIALWSYAYGQVARAQLTSTPSMDQICKQNVAGKGIFPVQTFKDEKSALTWLSGFELKHNKNIKCEVLYNDAASFSQIRHNRNKDLSGI